MNIWNPEYETMPREEVAQLQLERLQATLNRVYRSVAYYHKLFDSINFSPEMYSFTIIVLSLSTSYGFIVYLSLFQCYLNYFSIPTKV